MGFGAQPRLRFDTKELRAARVPERCGGPQAPRLGFLHQRRKAGRVPHTRQPGLTRYGLVAEPSPPTVRSNVDRHRSTSPTYAAMSDE